MRRRENLLLIINWKKGYSVFLLMAVFLLGCTSSHQEEVKQVLRLNISHEPYSIDPRKGRDYIGSAIQYLLFEGLLRLANDSSLIPAQAYQIDISDDQLTYTFHLRNALWSDGSKVTAQDFEYAWKTLLSPHFPAPNAYLFYPIKNAKKAKRGIVPIDDVGVVSKDEQTLVVTLKKPTPYFLKLVAFCAFFPVKHTEKQTDGSWKDNPSPWLISNGPFELKTWKHHEKLTLYKNESYWDHSNIHLNALKISMINDENTALNLYENGDLDVLGAGLSPIACDAASYYHKRGVLHTIAAPGTTIITFNTKKSPFNNIHIRKAFSYAINRAQITQNITQLSELPATSLIPPALMGGNVLPLFEDADTKSAKYHFALGLKELGLTAKQFPKITFNYAFSELNKKLAQALQDQWNKTLGIQVELHNLEHQILIENLTLGSYDFALSFWVAQYSDPMSILERFDSKHNYKNYTGWESSEYAKTLELSSSVISVKNRVALLRKAEKLIIDEMPICPIYHWQFVFLAKDYVHFEKLFPNGAFDYSRIHIGRKKPLLASEYLPYFD